MQQRKGKQRKLERQKRKINRKIKRKKLEKKEKVEELEGRRVNNEGKERRGTVGGETNTAKTWKVKRKIKR